MRQKCNWTLIIKPAIDGFKLRLKTWLVEMLTFEKDSGYAALCPQLPLTINCLSSAPMNE